MTIWHLKLFAAVAETGSMSAAAARYQIRQPSVSQKIAELERHYGVLLFERLGNHLRITEAGERLLPLAREVIGGFDNLEEAMAGERARGRVRIGGTVTVGSSVFPGLIRSFRAANPDTEVYACVSNTRTICGKLRSNELDVALVEGRPDGPDLVSLPKIEDFLVLACGRGHPFFSRDAVRAGELQDMEFVMRESGSGTRALFEQFLERRGVHIRTSFEYNNPDAMRSAVRVNNCLAVLSVRLMEEDARRGEARLFRFRGGEWARTFNLVYHRDKRLSRAAGRFCALLDQPFQSPGGPACPMGVLLDGAGNK